MKRLLISSPRTEPGLGTFTTVWCFCLKLAASPPLPAHRRPSTFNRSLANQPLLLSGFHITERLFLSDNHLTMGLIRAILAPSISKLGQRFPISWNLGLVLTSLPFSLTNLPFSFLKFHSVGLQPCVTNQSFSLA